MKFVGIKNEEGRTCAKCHEFKAWEEFNKMSSDRTGHRPRCRECQKKDEHIYPRDMEKHYEAMRRYLAKKKEKENEDR